MRAKMPALRSWLIGLTNHSWPKPYHISSRCPSSILMNTLAWIVEYVVLLLTMVPEFANVRFSVHSRSSSKASYATPHPIPCLCLNMIVTSAKIRTAVNSSKKIRIRKIYTYLYMRVYCTMKIKLSTELIENIKDRDLWKSVTANTYRQGTWWYDLYST